MAKRGQAAMEFLMTYGWAILAVIITIAALAYFGVLNPSLFLPTSCTMFPGIACTDVVATSLEVYVTVQNGFGQSLSQFDVSVPGCGIGSAVNGLADGEKETVVIPICNFAGKRSVKDTLLVTYTAAGLQHNRVGSLSAPIEGNINQPGSNYKSVNFYDRNAAAGPRPVSDYINDAGLTGFSAKNYSILYGWTAGTPAMRYRTAVLPIIEPKQLLRSFAFVTSPAAATWELEMPNGNYYVSVAAGDSENPQGPHYMTIEGVTPSGFSTTGSTTAPNTFLFANDVTVAIADGDLTVIIGGGASGNSLINYIRIRPR